MIVGSIAEIFALRFGFDVILAAMGFNAVGGVEVSVGVEPDVVVDVFDVVFVVDVDDFGDLAGLADPVGLLDVGLLVVGLLVVLLVVGLPGAAGLVPRAFESAYAGESVRHAAAVKPMRWAKNRIRIPPSDSSSARAMPPRPYGFGQKFRQSRRRNYGIVPLLHSAPTSQVRV